MRVGRFKQLVDRLESLGIETKIECSPSGTYDPALPVNHRTNVLMWTVALAEAESRESLLPANDKRDLEWQAEWVGVDRPSSHGPVQVSIPRALWSDLPSCPPTSTLGLPIRPCNGISSILGLTRQSIGNISSEYGRLSELLASHLVENGRITSISQEDILENTVSMIRQVALRERWGIEARGSEKRVNEITISEPQLEIRPQEKQVPNLDASDLTRHHRPLNTPRHSISPCYSTSITNMMDGMDAEDDTQCMFCDSEVGSAKRKRVDLKFHKLSHSVSLGSFTIPVSLQSVSALNHTPSQVDLYTRCRDVGMGSQMREEGKSSCREEKGNKRYPRVQEVKEYMLTSQAANITRDREIEELKSTILALRTTNVYLESELQQLRTRFADQNQDPLAQSIQAIKTADIAVPDDKAKWKNFMPHVITYCKKEKISLELKLEMEADALGETLQKNRWNHSYCLGTTIPFAETFRLPIIENCQTIFTATLAILQSHFKLSDTTILVLKPVVQGDLVNEGCVELLKKGILDCGFTFEGNCRLVMGWIKTGDCSVPWAIYPKEKAIVIYGLGMGKRDRESLFKSALEDIAREQGVELGEWAYPVVDILDKGAPTFHHLFFTISVFLRLSESAHAVTSTLAKDYKVDVENGSLTETAVDSISSTIKSIALGHAEQCDAILESIKG